MSKVTRMSDNFLFLDSKSVRYRAIAFEIEVHILVKQYNAGEMEHSGTLDFAPLLFNKKHIKNCG